MGLGVGEGNGASLTATDPAGTVVTVEVPGVVPDTMVTDDESPEAVVARTKAAHRVGQQVLVRVRGVGAGAGRRWISPTASVEE